jgi:quinol monooxygenase YgiN
MLDRKKTTPVAQISKDNDVVTLVNVFTLSNSADQDKLVRLLDEATEKVMSHLDGFVSASIHRSLDGTRVVNYAQWRSKEAFEAMLQNQEARKHMSKAYELSKSEPHLYKVESIHTLA